MLLAQKDLQKGNISNLPMETQNEIIKIKNEISLDHESVSSYSQNVTNKLTDFSAKILDSVKVKDLPDTEPMLLELMDQLNQIDTTSMQKSKQNFLQKLFKKTNVDTLITKYESVSGVVSDVKNKLIQTEYQLKKDIKVCEKFLENNMEYIQELDKYLAAGIIKINEEEMNLNIEKAQIDNDDLLAVQELAMKESNLTAFKRKIHNLELQRAIAIQNIPQLMMLKEGNTVLIEKINDSINSVIPLWQSQIVISIQAMRQENGAKVQQSISNATNTLLKQNANALKQSAISVANELERDIVDIDTLKHSNEQLISTISTIKEIQTAGEKKREEAVEELAKLHLQLNQALIDVNSSQITTIKN